MFVQNGFEKKIGGCFKKRNIVYCIIFNTKESTVVTFATYFDCSCKSGGKGMVWRRTVILTVNQRYSVIQSKQLIFYPFFQFHISSLTNKRIEVENMEQLQWDLTEQDSLLICSFHSRLHYFVLNPKNI